MGRPAPDWFDYDPSTEVVTIMGIRFTKALFEHFAASPCGISFRIAERKDGAFTITQETDPLAAAARDMLAALQFYADEKAYFDRNGVKRGNPMRASDVDTDGGDRARAALSKATGEA